MSPALDTMPPATKAELLRRVLGMKHKYEKGSIAAAFGITIAELQTIIDHHGGGQNRAVMQRHVDELTAEALRESDDVGVVADEQPEREAYVPLDPDRRARAQDMLAANDTDDVDAVSAEKQDTNVPAHGQLTRVALHKLLADPQNLRDDLREIDELAETIKQVGLITPIVVRTEGQRLVVVDGHRRLAAARRLKHDKIDAIIRPSMKTADVIAAMLITSGQRADLDPIEEARGLMRLKVERGNISDGEVGAIVGRNQVFVSNRLALLNLTPEQQAEVRAGNMKLVEATHHGRMNAGKVNKKGQDKNWHLGPQHPLANQAKARCTAKGHPRGRTVGGMACGGCWEDVIRTNERVQLVQRSIEKGQCDTCGQVTSSTSATLAEGANQ